VRLRHSFGLDATGCIGSRLLQDLSRAAISASTSALKTDCERHSPARTQRSETDHSTRVGQTLKQYVLRSAQLRSFERGEGFHEDTVPRFALLWVAGYACRHRSRVFSW